MLRDASLIVLLIGLFLIFVAFHNIDIAWNMNLIGANWKYDMNLKGEIHTAPEIYLNALMILLEGVGMIVLAFLIAYLG